MKILILLLILVPQTVLAAECFKAEIDRGSIDSRRREAILVMQYAGNSGGLGFVGVMSKDGSFQASGETPTRYLLYKNVNRQIRLHSPLSRIDQR